jgi:hypothetical protein
MEIVNVMQQIIAIGCKKLHFFLLLTSVIKNKLVNSSSKINI